MTATRCPRCNEVVEVNVDYGKEDTSAIQLLELVDGALEVVALWKAESPAQKICIIASDKRDEIKKRKANG